MDEESPHKKLKEIVNRGRRRVMRKVVSHRSRKTVFQGKLFKPRGQINVKTNTVFGLSSSSTTGDLSHMGKWLWRISPWVDC